jgi:hypothetical protein
MFRNVYSNCASQFIFTDHQYKTGALCFEHHTKTKLCLEKKKLFKIFTQNKFYDNYYIYNWILTVLQICTRAKT